MPDHCSYLHAQSPGPSSYIKEFNSAKGIVYDGERGLLMDMVDVNGKKASPVYTHLKVRGGSAWMAVA